MKPPNEYTALRPLPLLIFSSRWLQLPLYLGLIVAQCVYVFLFMKELWHLISHAVDFSEQEIMLVVLGLIDVVMISNLLVMVIVGGYETFISRLGLKGHPDEPEWLSHVNSGILKVKLAMAIIGISSIHLLRTFIEAGEMGKPESHVHPEGVMWQAIIHSIFILSAIGVAFVDRLSQDVPHHAAPHPIGHDHPTALPIGHHGGAIPPLTAPVTTPADNAAAAKEDNSELPAIPS